MLNLKVYKTLQDYVMKNSIVVKNSKEELICLEKKEKYLRSISLHHQTKIAKDSEFSKIWESSPDTNVNENGLSKMESLLSQCVMVSGNEEATTKLMEVNVEDEEENNDEENGADSNKVENVILKKDWKMEGKVDQISYAMIFATASSSKDAVEDTVFILDAALSESDSELEAFKQSAISSDDMQSFIIQLQNYQLLIQDRIEAMDELEDYENMEIRRSENPAHFLFVPIKDHEINVLWKVVWDELNLSFKHEIWIDCNDDVVARFSQKKDAFPFLKGSKKLRNRKEVIQFFGYFVDDLLESCLNR